MAYSEKVIEHAENPRNVGTLDKEDPSVGTGLVGAPACGDVMRLQIKVGEGGLIEDAKFKTFGCGSAIASSSLATEWIKGKTIDEAAAIKNSDIVTELNLPPVKIHCSVLAEDAIKSAIADYRAKQAAAREGVNNVETETNVPAGHQANTDYRPPAAGATTGVGASMNVSLAAIEAIQKNIAKRGTPHDTTALRVGIRGGGCSGFSYVIEFHDGAPRARDRVMDFTSEDGTPVRVLVDPKSLINLNGSTLDWEKTVMQQGFKFRNPNEKTSCRLRHVVYRLSGHLLRWTRLPSSAWSRASR